MQLKLRTLVYSGKIEIDNVPIYSCPSCSRSEVLPTVKTDLTVLLKEYANETTKQNILFNERNEWADLLVEYKLLPKTKASASKIYEQMLVQRTNELLDLYLLAQSLNDQKWLESIHKRLEQLSCSQ